MLAGGARRRSGRHGFRRGDPTGVWSAVDAPRMTSFTDPATNVTYDVRDPDYAGWLTKQSRWLKDWRRRFFILKQNKLFFARSESEVRGAPAAKARGGARRPRRSTRCGG